MFRPLNLTRRRLNLPPSLLLSTPARGPYPTPLNLNHRLYSSSSPPPPQKLTPTTYTSLTDPLDNPSTPTLSSPSSSTSSTLQPTKKKMTQAELDEELKRKLEEMSGEGGGAGVEYEDGKAVGMKRGVRENMFRLI